MSTGSYPAVLDLCEVATVTDTLGMRAEVSVLDITLTHEL